jgi:hypothetical protein
LVEKPLVEKLRGSIETIGKDTVKMRTIFDEDCPEKSGRVRR